MFILLLINLIVTKYKFKEKKKVEISDSMYTVLVKMLDFGLERERARERYTKEWQVCE